MNGYAVYYKDKDGFDIILTNENTGGLHVYSTKEMANKSMEILKENARLMQYPPLQTRTEGVLWWKKTYNIPSNVPPLTRLLGRQIFNTIDVKRVKVI